MEGGEEGRDGEDGRKGEKVVGGMERKMKRKEGRKDF